MTKVCHAALRLRFLLAGMAAIRGITLDTGALVAIERRKQRGTQLLKLARQRLAVLSVSVPVIAEWWRGRTDIREKILDVVNVEPLSLLSRNPPARRRRAWRGRPRSTPS